MLTRVISSVPRPSSAGGTAVSISATCPSAGETTTPGRLGGTRCGCRKKAAFAAVAASAESAHPAVPSAQNGDRGGPGDERHPGGMQGGDGRTDQVDDVPDAGS